MIQKKGTLFSVGYEEKDIQDIQDIRKTPITTSYFAYLLNQTPFTELRSLKKNVMVKTFLKKSILFKL